MNNSINIVTMSTNVSHISNNTNINLSSSQFNNIKNNLSINKDIWLNFKFITDLVLNECNGYIFGGYVRDSILHNHYATEYYKVHDLPNNTENIKLASLNYTNLEYYPELLNRLLLPADLDIYLPDNNIDQFIENLSKNNYKIIKSKTKRGRQYFLNFNPDIVDNLTQYTLYIKPSLSKIYNILSTILLNTKEIKNILKNMNNKLFIIKLDIFISQTPYDDPFFGDIDFECNGLYLTKHGLAVSKQLTQNLSFLDKHMKLQRIINDIIIKNAVWLNPTTYRIYKMIIKEWNIFNDKVSIMISYDTEICLICRDDCSDMMFKMKCCEAKFHFKCFINLNTQDQKNKCIHCNYQY
jgi:hypothetical protein